MNILIVEVDIAATSQCRRCFTHPLNVGYDYGLSSKEYNIGRGKEWSYTKVT